MNFEIKPKIYLQIQNITKQILIQNIIKLIWYITTAHVKDIRDKKLMYVRKK